MADLLITPANSLIEFKSGSFNVITATQTILNNGSLIISSSNGMYISASAVLPAIDNLYDLGSPSNRWRRFYGTSSVSSNAESSFFSSQSIWSVSSSFASSSITSSYSRTASYVGSGTENRLIKWTATNTLQDSSVYDNGSSVSSGLAFLTVSSGSTSIGGDAGRAIELHGSGSLLPYFDIANTIEKDYDWRMYLDDKITTNTPNFYFSSAGGKTLSFNYDSASIIPTTNLFTSIGGVNNRFWYGYIENLVGTASYSSISITGFYVSQSQWSVSASFASRSLSSSIHPTASNATTYLTFVHNTGSFQSTYVTTSITANPAIGSITVLSLTGSATFAVSSSYALTTRNLDQTAYNISVSQASQSYWAVSASYASQSFTSTQALTASYLSQTAFNISVSQASQSFWAVSASFASRSLSSSIHPTASNATTYLTFVHNTGSFQSTYVTTSITANPAVGSITVLSLTGSATFAVSSSYAVTARNLDQTAYNISVSQASQSYWAVSASYASQSLSSSYSLTSSYLSGAFDISVSTASYSLFAELARSASHNLIQTTASNATTYLTFVHNTGSYQSTYVTTSITSNPAVGSITVLSLTGSATFAVSSSYVLSSSYAVTARNLDQTAYNISVSQASQSFWAISASFASQSLSSSYAKSASFIGIGVDNYVPKWVSNSLTSTSSIYDTGTNVGIGNNFTGPSSSFHVKSPVLYSGPLSSSLMVEGGNNGVLLNVTDDLSNAVFSVNNSSGLPIIEAYNDDMVIMGQYGQNDFILKNNVLTLGYSASINTKLAISGSVGIGTTNAVMYLDVRGDAMFGTSSGTVYVKDDTLNFRYDSSATSNGYINYYGYAGAVAQFRNCHVYNGKGSQIATFDGVNSRVGIGVTDPIAKLENAGMLVTRGWMHINNSTYRGVAAGDNRSAISFGSTNNVNTFFIGATTDTVHASTQLGIYGWQAGLWAITVDTTANVGIQTSTVSDPLHVNGKTHLNGNVGIGGSPGSNVEKVTIKATTDISAFRFDAVANVDTTSTSGRSLVGYLRISIANCGAGINGNDNRYIAVYS